MIHGVTKIELTYDSVREAIQEWLQSHMASSVTVKLDKWTASAHNQFSQGSQTINAEFSQATEPTDDESATGQT